MNYPPGGQGPYGGDGAGAPRWRTGGTIARPGTGFNKKGGGGGCALIVAVCLALACVAGGAVGLVLFLKGRRPPIVDGPVDAGAPFAAEIATTARPSATPDPPRPVVAVPRPRRDAGAPTAGTTRIAPTVTPPPPQPPAVPTVRTGRIIKR